MTHIMVDLETWGLRPGCALRSIGAVAFDPVAGITGERFYRNITVDSCTDRGLTLDPKTVEWWESQSDAAKSAFDDDPVSVWSALAAFRGFWEANQGVEIWCYGANADEPWMQAAFAVCGLEAPWHYRKVRCARTVLELAGVEVDRETGTHHHALDDAVQQAAAVIQAYRVLAIETKRSNSWPEADGMRVVNERDFGAVTLHHLQQTQPWTIPYNSELNIAVQDDAGLGHLMGTHCVLHAQKTLGQIAAVFEGLDHTSQPITDGQVQQIADKSADLVTAAMRFANLYRFDLATAVVERSEEKNNVTLPAWPAAA